MTEIKFFIDGNEITIKVQAKNDVQEVLTGEGLLDFAIKKDFSHNIKELLNKYGDEIITGITIFRTPLQKAMNAILNIASFGQYEKAKNENKYDDYFHLGLNITTQSDKKFVWEKTEQVQFYEGHVNKPKTEFMNITNVPENVSLKTFIDNTKQQQGNKMFNYSASSNNCQVFIKDALVSNGLGTPEYLEFVVQDTGSIFKGMPEFRKLANSITDLGNVAAGIKNEVEHVQEQVQKEVVNTANVVADNVVQTANKVADNVVQVANNVANTTNDVVKTVKRKAKKTGRKIKKFFGGNLDEVVESEYTEETFNPKDSKKELKDFIKRNKHKFNRKVNIANLTKSELIKLCEEIC